MYRCNSRAITLTRVLAVAILFSATQLAWSRTDKNPDGLPNFAHVTDVLYRGAQPTSLGFSNLHKMGVAIIVNFRDEPDEIAAEKHEVESLGMKYVGIPWSASNNPSDAQVVQFLDLVRANPQTKVFVHCRRGADRTGTMIAAFRIAVEHKTVTEAVAEMHQFHYNRFFRPHLQRYVTSFPQSLQTNKLYGAYAIPAARTIGDVVTTNSSK